MSSYGLTPLIAAKRNGILECLHLGAVAHVNAHGKVLHAAGNPHWQSFTRSTLKPLQALPFVNGGGPKLFNFSQEQTALLCASHNGEPVHVDNVQGMLQSAGLTHKALRCGCEVPSYFGHTGQAVPTDFVPDECHHNCSGKHAGMLAFCVQHGLVKENYIDYNHPLQVQIRAAIGRVTGLDGEQLPHGTDGCSAPNYVLPLSALATAFARMASAVAGSTTHKSYEGDAPALATLGLAMATQPYMVSGQTRNDLALVQAGRGDWITKIGADGVQVVASIGRGEAFALKIIDASKPASHAATVAVLDKLGWLDDAQRQQLAPWRWSPIVNVAGLEVGTRSPVFELTA